uniref:Caffeoyl-CoA O-methyltransferase n=1 Tax=Arion vulgaris TaxID=1028688 RepID=A0A0B6Z9A8_9EUPU
MSTHDLSHYDPAVNEVHKALELAKSSGATPELIKTIESALELTKLREDFAHNTTSKESQTLKEILAETYRHDWESVHQQGKSTWHLSPVMMSGPLEGQFLKTIASIQKPKRILDIGLFTGYSALSMAEALPADGEVVSIEIDEYLKPLVTDLLKSSPHGKKVQILVGKALDVLKNLAADGERFDLIFMDADKDEYIDYFKYAFEGGLLNPGGTLLVDNAFLFGSGYIPSSEVSSTKAFANAVSSDASLHSVLVPIRDGVLIIRRLSDVEGGI